MKVKARANTPALLEDQRRRLARWLKEWDLDRILRSEDEIPAAESSPDRPNEERLQARSRPFATTALPQVGDIRVLYPAPHTAAALRPVYVGVLQEQDDAMFLVAPFGRFSEPALPGEWRTGLTAMPVRVLCLWNSRRVAGTTLGMSWRADRLKPGQIRAALEVLQHGCTGVPLVTVRVQDIGPPVRHPRDPRLTYQVEEANAFDELLSAMAPRQRRPLPDRASTGMVYESGSGTWLLAAESPETYGSKTKRKGKQRKRDE